MYLNLYLSMSIFMSICPNVFMYVCKGSKKTTLQVLCDVTVVRVDQNFMVRD